MGATVGKVCKGKSGASAPVVQGGAKADAPAENTLVQPVEGKQQPPATEQAPKADVPAESTVVQAVQEEQQPTAIEQVAEAAHEVVEDVQKAAASVADVAGECIEDAQEAVFGAAEDAKHKAEAATGTSVKEAEVTIRDAAPVPVLEGVDAGKLCGAWCCQAESR